jgi:hypothetical protein
MSDSTRHNAPGGAEFAGITFTYRVSAEHGPFREVMALVDHVAGGPRTPPR